MLNFAELERLGKEAGFTNIAPLDVSTIELKPEVRDMCRENTCGQYGSSWSCPPGCGTLEQCRDRIFSFREGILVQTVGELEDELDGEGMMEAEANHKKHFETLRKVLREKYPKMLPLGAGGCRRCKKCTYPDEPCRFPEELSPSMEACGMLILEVCRKNNLKYYYGSSAIAYTSCFLLE